MKLQIFKAKAVQLRLRADSSVCCRAASSGNCCVGNYSCLTYSFFSVHSAVWCFALHTWNLWGLKQWTISWSLKQFEHLFSFTITAFLSSRSMGQFEAQCISLQKTNGNIVFLGVVALFPALGGGLITPFPDSNLEQGVVFIQLRHKVEMQLLVKWKVV